MSEPTLTQLAASLDRARNPREFFTKLSEHVESLPEYDVQFHGDAAVRVVFFGLIYSNELAYVLLRCPHSRGAFGSVKDLRFVATEIDRALAEQFRTFNPTMTILWMSDDDWCNPVIRPSGSLNPAIITQDLPRNYRWIIEDANAPHPEEP